MADIVIKFNTNDKKASVTVDGSEVGDVVDACVGKRYDYDGKYEDDFYCSVSTVSVDESNKTKMLTRLVASESREGKALASVAGRPASPVPGFEVESVVALSKLARDINDFMNSLRR